MKIMKRSARKNSNKKKFQNAMHRKVETKQCILSVLEWGKQIFREARRHLFCVRGGGRRCTKFEVTRTNFK